MKTRDPTKDNPPSHASVSFWQRVQPFMWRPSSVFWRAGHILACLLTGWLQRLTVNGCHLACDGCKKKPCTRLRTTPKSPKIQENIDLSHCVTFSNTKKCVIFFSKDVPSTPRLVKAFEKGWGNTHSSHWLRLRYAKWTTSKWLSYFIKEDPQTCDQ